MEPRRVHHRRPRVRRGQAQTRGGDSCGLNVPEVGFETVCRRQQLGLLGEWTASATLSDCMPESADENEPPPLVAPVSVNGRVGPSGTPPVSAPRRIVAPANPFDVSAAYAISMRLSLALGLVPGLGTGLLLVLVAGAGVASQHRLAAASAGTRSGPGARLHAVVHSGRWFATLPALSRRTVASRAASPVGCEPGGVSAGRAPGRPAARAGTGRVLVLVFSTLALPGRHADGGLGIPRSEPSVCAA